MPVPGKVAEVTAEKLKPILAEKKPVLLDFFATWCGTCVSIAPKIDDLAAKNTHVTILKIDADESGELCGEYEVAGLPTFIALKDGKECGRVVGGAIEKIEELVGKLKP